RSLEFGFTHDGHRGEVDAMMRRHCKRGMQLEQKWPCSGAMIGEPVCDFHYSALRPQEDDLLREKLGEWGRVAQTQSARVSELQCFRVPRAGPQLAMIG